MCTQVFSMMTLTGWRIVSTRPRSVSKMCHVPRWSICEGRLTRCFIEPPRGIEPRTYALRDSAVADGCRRLVSFNAGSLPHCPWLVGAGYGWRRMGGGISGADECGSGGAASSETSQLRPVLATWQQAPSSGGRTMCPFEGYTPLCDAVGGLRQTAAGAFAASDAAGLVGPHGDLDAVSGAELSHEAGEVGFDGAWGDVELAGDLIVGAALGYGHEDFLLAGGERFYRLPRWEGLCVGERCEQSDSHAGCDQCVSVGGGVEGLGQQGGSGVFEQEPAGAGFERPVDILVEVEGGDDHDRQGVGDVGAGEASGGFDVGLGLEQHRQPGAHDGLVVGDEDPDAHRGVPVRGRTASTRQPRSAVGPAWKVPPSSEARSRMPTRP